jgi:hypothetical protein
LSAHTTISENSNGVTSLNPRRKKKSTEGKTKTYDEFIFKIGGKSKHRCRIRDEKKSTVVEE